MLSTNSFKAGGKEPRLQWDTLATATFTATMAAKREAVFACKFNPKQSYIFLKPLISNGLPERHNYLGVISGFRRK